MKYLIVVILFGLIACNSNENQSDSEQIDSTNTEIPMTDIDTLEVDEIPSEIYTNERFREVSVENNGDNSYTIRGKAQIFEASFNWVVEDGHMELLSGFQTTSAGAPEWGDFEFTIEVQKVRENSTLHIILYEASAKDGSRQFELPVVLK